MMDALNREILVVLVPTAALGPEERWLSLCSPVRLNRLQALRHEAEWRRSLGAELALHFALQSLWDGYRAPPRYVYQKNGRPELLVPGLFMSLAHAGDMAACALFGQRVGLDLERRDRPAPMPIADWVAMESYLKWTGRGLSGGWRNLKPSEAEMRSEGGETLACLHRAEVEEYLLCAACRERAQLHTRKIDLGNSPLRG